jgi:hypothetical protein
MAHNDDIHFIINMHALHNATLIRRLLPRSLTIPNPKHEDREAYHNQLAIEVRKLITNKRRETTRKRNETWARNKKQKADKEAAMAGAQPQNDEENGEASESEEENIDESDAETELESTRGQRAQTQKRRRR